MKKYKFEIKYITCSALITLLILTLFSGFIIADANTRKVGFNDNEPLIIFENKSHEPCAISIRFMDKILTLDFTEEYHLKQNIAHNFTNTINYVSKTFSKLNLEKIIMLKK